MVVVVRRVHEQRESRNARDDAWGKSFFFPTTDVSESARKVVCPTDQQSVKIARGAIQTLQTTHSIDVIWAGDLPLRQCIFFSCRRNCRFSFSTSWCLNAMPAPPLPLLSHQVLVPAKKRKNASLILSSNHKTNYLPFILLVFSSINSYIKIESTKNCVKD